MIFLDDLNVLRGTDLDKKRKDSLLTRSLTTSGSIPIFNLATNAFVGIGSEIIMLGFLGIEEDPFPIPGGEYEPDVCPEL